MNFRIFDTQYRGKVVANVSGAFNFDECGVWTCTVDQGTSRPCFLSVGASGSVIVAGVQVSKEECLQLVQPLIGKVELSRNHSCCFVDFPVQVTHEMLDEASLTHKRGWVRFEDLRVNVGTGGTKLTIVAKKHPEMNPEEQATQTRQRLCEKLGCE